MAEGLSKNKIMEVAEKLSENEMARIQKDALESLKLVASAVRCSYCEKLYKDEEEHDMGFEANDWAVCTPCFRKFCDAMLKKNTGGAM